MKCKSGFKLRPLGGEFILVGEGIEQVNFNKMITMNESAAYLWNRVASMDSFSAEDMAALLTEEYEVGMEQALEDCRTTMQNWQEAGIVE